MRSRLRRAEEGGFTLLELLIVIILIGILAAIAIPTFLRQRGKAYVADERSALRNLGTMEEAYLSDHDHYGALVDLTEYSADPDVVVTIVAGAGTATGFCASAQHVARSAATYYDSTAGGVLDAGATCS